MTKFWVVAKQVYKKNVRSGSWIFLVLSPIIMGAIVIGISVFMSKTMDDARLGVVAPTPAVSQSIKQSTDSLKLRTYSTPQKAQTALKKSQIDGMLIVTSSQSGQLRAKLTTRIGGTPIDSSSVQSPLNQLNMQLTAQRLNLSGKQLRALLTPVNVQTHSVAYSNGKKVNRKNTTDTANRGIAVGITILMMIFMMVYGSMLAQEIATEKGSRIMEMLLSSVSATTQFFGKLAGVMLLLMTQIAIYGLSFALSWSLIKKQKLIMGLIKQFDFSALASWAGLSIVLFFILGVLTYAVLAALMGSLVANQEQVQQAVMPLSLLGMLGYFGALIAQASDNVLVRVGSYVPFLNVSIMPVRATMGYTSSFEVPLALGESLLFLLLFTYFAVRVYRANVLVYREGSLAKALRATVTMMRAQK
jgi:ABC-2 type transport system permease protein